MAVQIKKRVREVLQCCRAKPAKDLAKCATTALKIGKMSKPNAAKARHWIAESLKRSSKAKDRVAARKQERIAEKEAFAKAADDASLNGLGYGRRRRRRRRR